MNIASTHDKLILIGLGANLPGTDGASPIETLDAALVELELPAQARGRCCSAFALVPQRAGAKIGSTLVLQWRGGC